MKTREKYDYLGKQVLNKRTYFRISKFILEIPLGKSTK